jgi:UDP-N-acetylglucosamine 2-epimerase
VWELKKSAAEFDTLVVATGQHRQMLNQIFSLCHFQPDMVMPTEK